MRTAPTPITQAPLPSPGPRANRLQSTLAPGPCVWTPAHGSPCLAPATAGRDRDPLSSFETQRPPLSKDVGASRNPARPQDQRPGRVCRPSLAPPPRATPPRPAAVPGRLPVPGESRGWNRTRGARACGPGPWEGRRVASVCEGRGCGTSAGGIGWKQRFHSSLSGAARPDTRLCRRPRSTKQARPPHTREGRAGARVGAPPVCTPSGCSSLCPGRVLPAGSVLG